MKKLKLNNKRRKIVSLLFFGILVLTLFSFMSSSIAENQGYNDISVEDAYAMINNKEKYPNLIILDVRTESEYNSGHILDAILIPLDDLETRINEIDDYKNSEIIVYCRAGVRSSQASETLVQQEFKKIYNMLGGFDEWKAVGYPITSNEGENQIDFSLNLFIVSLVGTITILTIYYKKKLKIFN